MPNGGIFYGTDPEPDSPPVSNSKCDFGDSTIAEIWEKSNAGRYLEDFIKSTGKTGS